ncbi:MAG: polysaccharide deacetylase family protein [Patescibacteria group bacterium]
MFLKRIIKDEFALISLFFPSKKGISVLMYHSVAHNNVFFTVKPEMFEKQMRYLKNRDYNVIKLSDLVNLLESNEELPKKTVVLTFDDGFEDNYTNVFPILKKYNFPATIFLITGLVNREMNNSQNIPLRILNWKQIQEMHQSGLIDFQPHTVNHQEINKEEIINSKKEIEERLNKKCEFFAYPRGVYNNEIIGILKNNGFKASRTVENGKINKGDDLFKLKRISINSTTSFIQFKASL